MVFQKANCNLFMHHSQSTFCVITVCESIFGQWSPNENLTLMPIYWVCVCLFGDTSTRNQQMELPILPTNTCFPISEQLNAIKWHDYVKACTTERTWRHAHGGQTPSARTQSHSHTDEWNGPGLRRLTFAGSHLGRGKLSQVLLYVVQNFHWVLVWTGFQSVPSAHCGCGHTQTHTQQKHARTHTHGHECPFPDMKKDVNMQMILLVRDLKMRDEDEMRVN